MRKQKIKDPDDYFSYFDKTKVLKCRLIKNRDLQKSLKRQRSHKVSLYYYMELKDSGNVKTFNRL